MGSPRRLPVFEDFTQFPSLFDVGDPVYVEAQGKQLEGWVRATSLASNMELLNHPVYTL